jgi:hypothetical protein
MLKRFLTLFTPIEPPDDGLDNWEIVRESCREWATAKHSDLAQWAGEREKFGQDSYDEYLARRDTLLKSLTKAGKRARKSLLSLERSYRLTGEAIKTVSDQGFEIDQEMLKSHLHISPKVMDRLDEVYVKHYQDDDSGDRALIWCFKMMGASERSAEAREKYEGYLGEVLEVLTALSSTPESKALLAIRDLQAFGLKQAVSKLVPLFGPVQGRVCLPLPTSSMLADLRVCLMVNVDIMAEVLHFRIWRGDHLIIPLGRAVV